MIIQDKELVDVPLFLGQGHLFQSLVPLSLGDITGDRERDLITLEGDETGADLDRNFRS